MMNVLCVIFLVISLCSSQNLQQIHVLFRHGLRSPTSTFASDEHKHYKWDGGSGQLTSVGKLQMYKLGQNLRSKYDEFIPRYYFPVDVNFTSSPHDRCLMSAELVGAGLFPPIEEQIWNSDLLWQPIPVHYLPRNLDNLMAMKTNCTKYDEAFREVQNSSKVKKYNEDYKILYKFLTDHAGQTIDNIEAVESIYNTLEIYQLSNISLPFWVNDSLMHEMRNIGAQNLAIYSETEFMKRMKGGYFLRTILDLMDSTLSKKSIPKINLYSGHDLTIVHVIRALGLTDTLKPDFGAALVFELNDDSTMKVFYWDNWEGQANEQILANCSTPCNIEVFQKAYQMVLPVNWTEECQMGL